MIKLPINVPLIFIGESDNLSEWQYLKPVSMNVSGTWTPSTGTDLYATIDENIRDDTDFDYTFSSDDEMEFQITSGTEPKSSLSHKIKYAGWGNYTVSIYQGASLEIAAWVENDSSITSHERELTLEQLHLITDYTDLRVKIISG